MDDSRARQARIQRMIDSGVSVAEPHMVPDAAAAAAATAASSAAAAGGGGVAAPAENGAERSANGSGNGSGGQGKNSKHSKSASRSMSSRGSTSPSTSRNHRSGGGGDGGGGAAAASEADVGLRFDKQALPLPPAVGSGPRVQPSSLAKQLNMARGTLDGPMGIGLGPGSLGAGSAGAGPGSVADFPRSASMKICKYTVYLPHEEGSMVQIALPPTATAHELVKAALFAAREENGGEIPSGLIEDAYAYRAHVAEEDGEVDTDFPVLDVRVNVATLGVDSFVLRDRVDAGRPQALSTAAEGAGEDHSKSQQRTTIGLDGKARGFSSLETDTDLDRSRGKEEQGQGCCAGKCVVQ